ncbi:hypothetical protein [Prochlorothrix hollandica]|uniref:Uncharacterized protein n=1 Tax=Prochlorothrix hollandica PCC 9006 = CALU 1027 TaxID=317619 RepID=A0A0M2PX60_PROHO|nr:hypothetical protein [Prochlorothrix hollandica]KKI99258.1 hypothetical protein PROH_16110 [Prochlorothrix hollandica PCC 9006 = CALU 1027]
MAIIALKAWYLRDYEPIRELEKRPHDLRLNKNSLLKSGLRVDFLDDLSTVKTSDWFQRYLEGEVVEFYIEGSGGYAISNIDLMSQEIYFTKREVMAHLEPTIFFCYQTEFPESSALVREALQGALVHLNGRSRLPLTLEESNRLSDSPIRLQSTLMRKLRRSLVFVADATPIFALGGEHQPQLIPSPKVCVEVGYALECKRSEQVFLAQMERQDLPGQFPFDLPTRQKLLFTSAADLQPLLLTNLENQLQRFHLL